MHCCPGSRLVASLAGLAGRAVRALWNACRPLGVAGGFIADLTRSRAELVAENTLLRQQLLVAARAVKKPRFGNHLHQSWACDFLQLYDIWFRPIFAFFIMELGSRKVVHVAVTRHPSTTWVAQQLRNATPFGDAPRFVIRDNDDKFGPDFDRAARGAGIRVLRTAPRSPLMNSFCERFLGSVRRECLDHVVVLGERHLQRVLREYCLSYFNLARPHQGIDQLVPFGSANSANGGGEVVAVPVLGGLHHDYRRAA